MQLLNITKLPVYLPYDKAPVPFGDPFSDVTYTAATPAVFTVKGYAPNQNDALQFTVANGAVLDTNLAVGTTYYATSITAAAGTFSVSTQKNGSPLQSYTTGLQGGGQTTIHLISNEVDGVLLPFKSGNQVLAFNLTTAAVFLEGAPDLNTTTYGAPQGPGAATLLPGVPTTGIPANGVALVTLNNDWILTTSAGPGNLALVQN